jgi:hypothetical protein
MLSLIGANASSLEKDREILKEILSRDEFTVYYSQSQSTFAQLLEKVFKWIGERFPHFSLTEKAVDNISWGLVVVTAALLLFLIYWLVRQVRRQIRLKGGPGLSGGRLVTDYNYYLKQAKEFGSRGDWKEGIRHAFLSLLFFLDHCGWVRVEKWKTNFEYGMELRDKNCAWYETFRGMAVFFDRVWYGKLSVDGGEFERYLGEIEAGIRKGETDGPVEPVDG